MVFDAYSEANLARLEGQSHRKWMVTWEEAKLLFIASTGFFIDSYDLFTINIIAVILNVQYFGKLSGTITQIALGGGVLKAAANIGCVVGQVGFGIMGDVFGRKAVYGKELIVAMVATVMIIAAPSYIGGVNVFTWVTCFRILLGIGIGGDYPMSAAVVSDRALLDRRGLMLNFIFAMQGWGNLGGSIVTIVVLACFRTGIRDHGHYSQLNAVWRIIAGVILFPCAITLYQRLTMPESTKMKGVQALRDDPTMLQKGTISGLRHNVGEKIDSAEDIKELNQVTSRHKNDTVLGALRGGVGASTLAGKQQAWRDFRQYFSEWRHLRVLLGTTLSWFLVDITFYGINLNQSIVISSLGLSNSKEPWTFLWEQATANVIIAAAGFLPGYYFNMICVEYTGRKPLQYMGFIMNALFLGIIAGDYDSLRHKKAAFMVCFTFLQLFFNFGANTTTFIVPAETFPTRVRGAAHGLSAACGKCGAIISALGFAKAQQHIGTANVLWIFFAVSFLGAATTILIKETKGVDPDLLDLEERQAAAGYGQRVTA